MVQMEKALQKVSGLACGMKNNRVGFTLIELVVVIAVIAVLSAIVMPNFGLLFPGYERRQFIARFNELVQLGWRRAITTRKIHRIDVDIANRSVFLRQEAEEKAGTKNDEAYVPIRGAAIRTTISIPQNLEIKQFFIENFDEMSRFTSKKTARVYFFIVPDGLTQQVTINMVDTNDRVDRKPKQIGLVLNPFFAQFIAYDAFQKVS